MDIGILQIVAIGIVASVLAITLKNYSPQMGMMISIAAGVLIFILLMPQLSSVMQLLKSISDSVHLQASYMVVVMKVIGIAYIAEFGMQICSDAGEKAIASKIEMAGKIMIMVVSAPILLTLLDLILSLSP